MHEHTGTSMRLDDMIAHLVHAGIDEFMAETAMMFNGGRFQIVRYNSGEVLVQKR